MADLNSQQQTSRLNRWSKKCSLWNLKFKLIASCQQIENRLLKCASFTQPATFLQFFKEDEHIMASFILRFVNLTKKLKTFPFVLWLWRKKFQLLISVDHVLNFVWKCWHLLAVYWCSSNILKCLVLGWK